MVSSSFSAGITFKISATWVMSSSRNYMNIFLHADRARVVEILPHVKIWQLMIWWHKEPGHKSFNTLRPRQNGRLLADDVFKCIFLNENVWILLKFVPKGPINNIPSLVQVMAWRWPGDKPLSEPMMVSLLTDICITQPQWVNIIYVICHISFTFWEWYMTCNFNFSRTKISELMELIYLQAVYIRGAVATSPWGQIHLGFVTGTGHNDGLVQEWCNSSALAMELHLSCANQSI